MTEIPKKFMKVRYGLDLGQVNDYTALCAMEASEGKKVIRYLNRWRRESYLEIMKKCASVCNHEIGFIFGDATGGASSGVFELLEPMLYKSRLYKVRICSGIDSIYKDGYWHLPKHELITNLQLGFQNHDIALPKFQNGMDAILQNEVLNYVKKPKIESVSFQAREGEHDDLVLAVAMAYWGFNIKETVNGIIVKKMVRQNTRYYKPRPS